MKKSLPTPRGSPKPVKLYHFRDAPNPRRVRAFMAEKDLHLPLANVDLSKNEHRSEAFLEINSLGQVPVLALDDGLMLTESIAICRYLEDLHPMPALFGEGPVERASIEMWNRRIELEILNTIGNVASHTDPLFKDRIVQIPAFAQAERDAVPAKWAWLDREMADGRAFIAGDRFSVADITGMAASWLGEFLQIEIPAPLTHVRRWDERMRERPSWNA